VNRAAAGEAYGHAVPGFDTLDALLAEDRALDGLVIASPHVSHHAAAMAGLAAGLHCCIEKPMAVSGAEAREMVAAARAAGVEILVPCGWNFRPYSERAAALVASGAIGEVRHVVCHMASALTELFDGAPPRLASTCVGRSAPPPSFSHHAVLLPRGALWTE
jgi:predicted dehydrogenase